jgi:hypothetical protein
VGSEDGSLYAFEVGGTEAYYVSGSPPADGRCGGQSHMTRCRAGFGDVVEGRLRSRGRTDLVKRPLADDEELAHGRPSDRVANFGSKSGCNCDHPLTTSVND